MWENLLLFLEKETEGKQNSSIRMEIFQGNGPGRRDPAPEESPLALTASLWMGAVVFSLGIAALGWKGRELLKEALSDGRRVLLPGSGGKPFPGGEIPWVPFAGERLRLLCRKCPTADQEQEDFPEPDKPLAASFSFRKPVPPWEKAREPALQELARRLGLPLLTFDAAELAAVSTPHPSTAAGERFACAPFSVCEAACLLAARRMAATGMMKADGGGASPVSRSALKDGPPAGTGNGQQADGTDARLVVEKTKVAGQLTLAVALSNSILRRDDV